MNFDTQSHFGTVVIGSFGENHEVSLYFTEINKPLGTQIIWTSIDHRGPIFPGDTFTKNVPSASFTVQWREYLIDEEIWVLHCIARARDFKLLAVLAGK